MIKVLDIRACHVVHEINLIQKVRTLTLYQENDGIALSTLKRNTVILKEGPPWFKWFSLSEPNMINAELHLSLHSLLHSQRNN